jgi:hypothetical protein
VRITWVFGNKKGCLTRGSLLFFGQLTKDYLIFLQLNYAISKSNTAYWAFLGAEFWAPPFLTDEKLLEGIMEVGFAWVAPAAPLFTTSPLFAGAAFFGRLGFFIFAHNLKFSTEVKLMHLTTTCLSAGRHNS